MCITRSVRHARKGYLEELSTARPSREGTVYAECGERVEMGNCAKKNSNEDNELDLNPKKRSMDDSKDIRNGKKSYPLTPKPPPEPDYPVYVAKYDYDCRSDDDLGFRKGDLLYIISTEEGDWWFAQHKDTGQKGFIPSNYVAENQTLEAEE